MNKIGNIEIRELVRSAGMIERPEYYSGCSASLHHLNGWHLMNIYIALRRIDIQKAKEFKKMVFDMNDLAPTNFLNSLYSLQRNDFIYDPKLIFNHNIELGYGNDEERRITGLMSISASNHSDKIGKDETQEIKEDFAKQLVRASRDVKNEYNRKSELESLDYINFHMIKTKLQFEFDKIIIDGITYYIDKNNTVVATEEKDMLNLYFECSDTMWSHHGIAVMGVVKDFQLIDYSLQKDRRVQFADVAAITGLCGASNKLSQINKQIIQYKNDKRLKFDPTPEILNIELNEPPRWCSYASVEEQLSYLKNLKEELRIAKTKFEIGSLSAVEIYGDFLEFKVGDFIIDVNSNMLFGHDNIKYSILKKNLRGKINIPQDDLEFNSSKNKVKIIEKQNYSQLADAHIYRLK